MVTTLKICGMTDPMLLREAAQLSIDYFGFVFAPGSRRKVTPEQFARFDLSHVRGSVAVFVRPTLEEIAAAHAANRIDLIQLHGGEERGFIEAVKERFSLPVIRGVPGNREGLQSLKGEVPFYDILLVDTAGKKGFGGQGIPFDWSLIPFFRELLRPYGIPLWVAGGITPENVDRLLEAYEPDGIDVSSGVEIDGKKNLSLIQKLVKRVKG